MASSNMIRYSVIRLLTALMFYGLMLEAQFTFSQVYYEPISYPDTLKINSMYPFNHDTILIGTTCDNSYYWGCAYITYDGGETWEYAGLQNHAIYCFLRGTGDTIYAGASMGVYRTGNYGSNWDRIDSIQGNVVSLGRLNSGVIFAGYTGGVLRSMDNGITWDTTLALEFGSIINSILPVSENEVYACGTSYVVPGGGVFMTDDLGESWENIGLVSYNVQSLSKNQNDELFAGCYYSGLLRKSDNGNIWETVLPQKDVLSIIINSDGIYIGCDQQNFPNGGGIFYSNDNGVTWEDRTYNITNNSIVDISITSDQFFYSLSRWESIVLGPILNRSIDQVSINEHDVINDSDFKLFPNPASSYITLDLPSNFNYPGNVEIKIYNQKGQLIFQDSLTISSEDMSIYLDREKINTGVYYIQITTGNWRHLKKVILL